MHQWLQVPADVDVSDWSTLADRNASADAVGSAVTRIVAGISARLSLESPTPSALSDSALPDLSISATQECFSPSDDHDN